MNAWQTRDAPNRDAYAGFADLCNAGIGYTQGFSMLAAGAPDGTSNFNTAPTLISSAYVAAYLESDKSANGCYPSRLDPANEPDNYSGNYAHDTFFGWGYDDLVDPASPSPSVCTSFITPSTSNPCDVPRWAYYTAVSIHAMRQAIQGNSAYANVKVFGDGLANNHIQYPGASSNYPYLSQAWYDLYGNTPFSVDFAVQHDTLSATLSAPADATTGGLSAATVNQIYEKENTPGHFPSGTTGFSGYNPPGTMGYVPQTFEPLIGREDAYYGSTNDISNTLAVHYIPRDLLKAFDAGLFDLNFDFLDDIPERHPPAVGSTFRAGRLGGR